MKSDWFFRPTKVFKTARNTWKAEHKANKAFSARENPPILIYQMGKVGSASVYKTLEEINLPNSILHLHCLSGDLPKQTKAHIDAGIYPPPFHLYMGEAVRNIIKRKQDFPIKIISLVRDPIAFVVSNLFQNPQFFSGDIKTEGGIIDSSRAVKFLCRELRKPEILNYVYGWFNREFKEVFEIDVFAQTFPTEVGYESYSKGNIEALVIRLEDLSEVGPKAISDFLCLDVPINLTKGNLRSESKMAKPYRELLNKIYLDPSLCKQIYSSRFVEHFYSERLVNKFISKWSKNDFF